MVASLTAEQARAQIDVLHAKLVSRRPDIDKTDQYYRGEQPLVYATDEWKKIHADRYKDFTDNWCGVVGSAPVERTEINGFTIGDDVDTLSPEEKALWRDWQVNDGPQQASQGFLSTTVSRRSHVIVWGDDDGEPVMTWERPSQTIVGYDPANPRRRRAALKAWVDDDREYATLYTADHVWKFQRPAVAGSVVSGRTAGGIYVAGVPLGGWEPRQPVEDDTWPIPNPLGIVPMVEFPNRPMLGAEPISDIAGTMAMQDAINLLWAYLFTAADYASMPARVVLGEAPPKVPRLDENGQKIGELPIDVPALTKGRMMFLTGQNTKIDQWDAAKLDVFTDVITVAIRHLSAQTRTPIYLIHGELGNVNGETLTALDQPLVSKVREAHKFYEPGVREVFRLFALVRGNDAVAEACRTGTVQWANPETRSDAQVSDAASKDRSTGWPMSAVLRRRYGLPQAEIERVLAEIKAEQFDPYLARLDAKEAVAGARTAEPAEVG